MSYYRRQIELTDWIRQDEPLGYLVFCPESCVFCEYKIFPNITDAKDFANEHLKKEMDVAFIYPLYASHPIEE